MVNPAGQVAIILFRRGDVIASVAHMSNGKVDTATTEDIAKKADAGLVAGLSKGVATP
jgi:hypothetical protein